MKNILSFFIKGHDFLIIQIKPVGLIEGGDIVQVSARAFFAGVFFCFFNQDLTGMNEKNKIKHSFIYLAKLPLFQ
jgi:hypothetical protein